MNKDSPIPAGLGQVTNGVSAFAALNTIVDATSEYLALREEHRERRAQLDAYERLETERIRAAERVLTDYFDKAFAERRSNFGEMWARLDAAAESGDTATVAQLLNSIIDLARTSPLAELGELPKLRQALNDPDHEWKF